jgi:hypothetical protein
MFRDQNSLGAKRFFSSPKYQDRVWGTPTRLLSGTEIQAAETWGLPTTHLHLMLPPPIKKQSHQLCWLPWNTCALSKDSRSLRLQCTAFRSAFFFRHLFTNFFPSFPSWFPSFFYVILIPFVFSIFTYTYLCSFLWNSLLCRSLQFLCYEYKTDISLSICFTATTSAAVHTPLCLKKCVSDVAPKQKLRHAIALQHNAAALLASPIAPINFATEQYACTTTVSLLLWSVPKGTDHIAVKNIDAPMSTRVWQELEYRTDVCRVTRGAHIEHLWLSKTIKKLFQFSCGCEQFH